ncbi:MAG TPA: 50S ribosomal protein L4 [Candidatus Limnocylindria bacterium]|nr:50S ribosomal protein L4 [Candidatus Limnocylindria bacterium]
MQTLAGATAGDLEIQFEYIEDNKGQQAVHDTVVAYRAGLRRGTAATKTMGEVNGSGKKPWRQKGTGRARAGSFASPLWRGGGVTHGPQPRDFSKKVNIKVKRLALRRALSERIKAGDVIVLDDIQLTGVKTKDFVKVLQQLDLTDKTSLFLVGGENRNVELASRNIQGVALTTGKSVITYDLLKYDKLVFTKAGFEQIEARLIRKD